MSRPFTTTLRQAWTDVAGRRVRSLSTGRPAGLPEVVLLPGLGTVSYAEPWLVEMGRWTSATLLDLPGWRGGRGRSSPPTVEGVAEAAAGWLRATDRRDVVLVGHSSGAQSALRTALSEPGRLAGLVLAGPTLAPAARRPAGLLPRLAATLVRERWAEAPVVLPWYARGGLDWIRLVRSVIADEPEAVAGALRVPTHLMTGAEDRLAPPGWAQHLAGLCSGSYETLPDAHNNCFTAPAAAGAAVHRAVRAWTSDLTRPAA